MNLRTILLGTAFCILFLPTDLFAQQDAPGTLFDSTVVYRDTEIYFDSDESFLRPASDSLIRALQQEFAHRPEAVYLIQAHTDAVGSEAYNARLSQARADSVRTLLLELEVPPEQVRIETFGETAPQASNATDAGRQRNRRATIRLQETRTMFMLRGEIVEEESGEPMPADLILRYRERVDSFHTDDGFFSIPVPDQTVVSLEAFAEGYYFHERMMKTDSRSACKLKLPLPQLQVGMIIPLNNFYFVGNQDTLLPRSRPELYRLLRFMQVNPEVRIEIAGHVNVPNAAPVPLTSWSFRLSMRRAKHVYDYLIRQGIDAGRVAYIGFGNWNMRFPHARTQQEQELNRRVEIRIMGKEQVISREDVKLTDREFVEQRLEDWQILEAEGNEIVPD